MKKKNQVLILGKGQDKEKFKQVLIDHGYPEEAAECVWRFSDEHLVRNLKDEDEATYLALQITNLGGKARTGFWY